MKKLIKLECTQVSEVLPSKNGNGFYFYGATEGDFFDENTGEFVDSEKVFKWSESEEKLQKAVSSIKNHLEKADFFIMTQIVDVEE